MISYLFHTAFISFAAPRWKIIKSCCFFFFFFFFHIFLVNFKTDPDAPLPTPMAIRLFAKLSFYRRPFILTYRKSVFFSRFVVPSVSVRENENVCIVFET